MDLDLLVLGDANPDLVLRGGDVVPVFGQAERLVDEANLTVGGSGAIMELARVAAVSVDAVDATGAGDSFDAGFVAAMLAGEPLERCLELANVCGALSTRAVGGVDAQPTMQEALDALEPGSAA